MPLRERDRELRRRRHRRERIRKLLKRFQAAQSREERERLVQKMIKRAPWRYQEFLALLHSP
ncbi:MAG: hypothetical protein N0A24_12055 [Armatimonadetes bacterium]|nr:hypothetical protein [Armatimonadota bacterium]MDW8154901.1 hypothetical protein [Armatimonadota bacterium]